MAYAIGNKSKAMCDICGRKFSYQHLREDWRGLKVCAVDFDSRHPQTERNAKTSDAIALRNARPDKDVDGTADWDDLDQLAEIFTMHFGNDGLP